FDRAHSEFVLALLPYYPSKDRTMVRLHSLHMGQNAYRIHVVETNAVMSIGQVAKGSPSGWSVRKFEASYLHNLQEGVRKKDILLFDLSSIW
ncbi:hypothetical protein, partial [Gelidibacter salicanalis]|uniref:hypothetical protein n=1 Tax=Gelidibacter salicanalis TaxID=291193 RepID=UPI001F43DEC5